MIARALLLCLTALPAVADAHDFWLQPLRWQVPPRAPLGLLLQVGHGPDRQRSPIPGRRIRRFEAIAPGGRRIDLRPDLHVGGLATDASLQFAEPGTYVIVLETDNLAESHLPAIRFNAYLAAEGLIPAIALRARTGKSDADGAETYRRCARTIVQVGPIDPRGQAMIARAAGLNLEIVPDTNPQAIVKGGGLPVRILYRGAPLPGALVKLTDLDHDAQPIEQHRSDMHGRAVFARPGTGSWQLNVIWTRPQPRTSLVDFDTSFSSLSFGVED